MPLACLRSIFFPAFVASFMVLAGALYLEYGLGQIACVLCQVQRLLLGAFSLICLCVLIRRPGRAASRLCLWLCLALAFAGALLAAAHVWLQCQLPFADDSCLGAMAGLIGQDTAERLRNLWTGSSGCLPVTWSFLSLSVPEWSLLAFLGLGLLAGLQLSHRGGLNPGDPARS